MAEGTCAYEGCRCDARQGGRYCSDFCAWHDARGGREAQPCGCGHEVCEADALSNCMSEAAPAGRFVGTR